jgi:AraC-like DNA-binding protein
VPKDLSPIRPDQIAELFDYLEDVQAWVKDREGRYRWVNRSFQLNYAINRNLQDSFSEDVLGKTDYDLSPPFLADQFRLDDEHVLAGNRIINRIEMVGHPAGLTAWNVTNKIPLIDSNGNVIGTAGITRPLNSLKHEVATKSEFGPVLVYLRDHYHTRISNRKLAKIAHMSVRAFERKFRNSFHLTPQKYVRKIQLLMASRALVYTDELLADVALSCGFSDQSHFTREFRRYFGRTPRDYRSHYTRLTDDASILNPDAGNQ